MHDIRSILCHVDASPECARRITAARDIGAWAGADVACLYATTSSFIAMPFSVAESSAAGQMALQLDHDRRQKARAIFGEASGTAGCPTSWEQLDDTSLVIHGVARRALCSDLVVLGQRNPASVQGLPDDFVESVIADSGRPALVLPFASDTRSVGTRALVAWKASPESARALQAALPFLARARNVDVVTWEEPGSSDTAGRDQLTRYLQSHGVSATLHWYGAAPRDVGEALLSLAADLQSDLLVMGCYGHSRARELMLGGVSRTVLRSMTVPVLMTH